MGRSRIKERVNLLKLQNGCLGYFKAFFSGIREALEKDKNIN
jgi:hypothetical protein